jgi:hypothetical protein
VRYCESSDVFNQRLWALALGLLLSGLAAAQGSMSLTWNPPVSNTDGSPLTNLAGYKVYWGLQAGSYTSSATLSGAASAYRIEPLGSGTWFAAVAAINTASVESPLSNVVSKTIPGGTPLAPPGPVVNLTVTPTGSSIDVTADLVFWSSDFNYTSWIRGAGLSTLCFEIQGGGTFDSVRLANLSNVATVPAVGVNNDGIAHAAPCLTSFVLPLNTNGDVDGTVTGVSVRINGTLYALTRLGGSATSFPWSFSRRIVQ